jgi:hypothetical protein
VELGEAGGAERGVGLPGACPRLADQHDGAIDPGADLGRVLREDPEGDVVAPVDMDRPVFTRGADVEKAEVRPLVEESAELSGSQEGRQIMRGWHRSQKVKGSVKYYLSTI